MFKDNIVLPTLPGCYLLKNDKDQVIYIGKAKNLKKRVSQYSQRNNLDLKTQRMLSYVKEIDFVVTDSEVEALILENTLIKKYQPKYNIRLKDAKGYSYILLTDEIYPRVVIARKKIGKGRFYGPFVSARDRDYVLHFLRKTFTLRTCIRLPKKPCLRYHIHLCEAPCAGLITKQKYYEKIKKVQMVLSGKSALLRARLKKEMKYYSYHQDFEHALQIRDELHAVEQLREQQKIKRQIKYNEDILNYEIKDNNVYLILFNIYKGTLSQKNEFIFEHYDNFLEEFLVQYYSENVIPKEIILPETVSASLCLFLKHLKGEEVKITIPKKGKKKLLLDLVLKNIATTFFNDIVKVKILKKRLNLQLNPMVIECFDISHLSGTSTVGSMVQFRNGKPDKSNYRRFRIQTVEGIDDVAAIAEVVHRRYLRLKKENAEFPDLVIIDGGRGQLKSALNELEKLGINIPLISIAKQFEEIYIPERKQPLRLVKKDNALHFIQEIRDEAHRFAVKYNRLLRKKNLIK